MVRVPVFAVLLLLAVAPAASAAEWERVLGPIGEGWSLYAQPGRTTICTKVAQAEPAASEERACDRPGRVAEYDPWVSGRESGGNLPEATTDGKVIVGGATNALVAAVEHVVAGGRTVRTATVADPSGAPNVRFYLAELPSGPRLRRLLGPDGAILGAEPDVDPFADDPQTPAGAGARLAAGRDGRGRWRVRATVRRSPSPVRGDPARVVREICVDVRRRSLTGGGGQSVCRAPDDTHDLTLVHEGCGGDGRHVVLGLGPAGSLPRRAVLTDGRVLRLRPRTIPAALAPGALQALAVPVPRGVGVRRLEGGGPADTWGEGPPALNSCNGTSVALWSFVYGRSGPVITPQAVVAPPDGPAVHLGDARGDLCMAVARPATAGDCGPPAPGIDVLDVRTDAAERRLAFAADARVPAVRLRLSDGRTVDIRTVRPSLDAGAYAPHVAVASYAVPPGLRVRSAAALDPRGRPFESGWRTSQLPAAGPPARFHVGPARFTATTRRYPSGELLCLTVRPTDLPDEDCPLTPGTEEIDGWVDCRQRATVLVIGLSRRAAGVVVRARDGRAFPAEERRVQGRRLAVLVAPADAALRSIELLSRRDAVLERARFPAPPPRAQCGYRLHPDFDIDLESGPEPTIIR